MNKKIITALLIWSAISILFFFSCVGEIDKNGEIHGWFGSIRSGTVLFGLVFYAVVSISGFAVIIKISKIKHKIKAVLLISVLILIILTTQQIYFFKTTGVSCSFLYIGTITPKDYSYIFGDIQSQMMALSDDDYNADAKTLCDNIDGLELSIDQPLKDYGISLIYNTETGNTYLYSKNLPEILPKDKYETFTDLWNGLIVVNKALKEKPKGVYQSFRYCRSWGSKWMSLSQNGMGRSIYSQIPPIPGCFYNSKENKVYIPQELLPAYKIIYPNFQVPQNAVIKPNIQDNKTEPNDCQ